jgi:hypothetical protein
MVVHRCSGGNVGNGEIEDKHQAEVALCAGEQDKGNQRIVKKPRVSKGRPPRD